MKKLILLLAFACLLPVGIVAGVAQKNMSQQAAAACEEQLLDLAERHPQYRLLLVDLAAAHHRVMEAAGQLRPGGFDCAYELKFSLEELSERYADLKKTDVAFALRIRNVLLHPYYSGRDQKDHTMMELAEQAEDELAERHDIAVDIHRDFTNSDPTPAAK